MERTDYNNIDGTMSSNMLDKVVKGIVTDSLDWFLARVLRDHYDRRREVLNEPKEGSSTAIDYILNQATEPADGRQTLLYPPDSASQWLELYSSLGSADKKYGGNFRKQILLIYLKLDANSYLSHKENSTRTRTKDKVELASLETALGVLLKLPEAFDFSKSTIELATGLWAVDNAETNLIVSSLANPTINLGNYFESPKELTNIIVDSLIIDHNSRMALFTSRVHHYEKWDENGPVYNPIYAFLLISSGQLIEALKYERKFAGRENYQEILQRFIELCSEWNVTKLLNCLNLSAAEEEVLNTVSECSRPVTPSSTQTRNTPTPSRQKPKNRTVQTIRRNMSFNDSPARNTRSARKRKTVVIQ